MKRSTDHILTTHTGSLPRPDDLVDLLYAEEEAPQPGLSDRVRQAVIDSIKEQVELGIDVVNDGEMGRVGYSTYVNQRLTGYEEKKHVPRGPRAGDADFPGYAEWSQRTQSGSFRINRYACTGPVKYVGQAALQRDIENLKAAALSAGPEEVFMTSASPGVIAVFQPNQYYDDIDQYLFALADAMQEEYEAIHQAGFILQLDCPDVTGMGRALPLSPHELDTRLEAIERATANIPADRIRLHLCWGNFEGPHHLDTPLAELLPGVLKARVGGISFEGANPRHEHEWNVFERVQLPEDKLIIPGVLDTTTNYIEHPELVAQRIVRYAHLVGRERVIASTDCGFGTFAGTPMVHPAIVRAKLASMVEGARLATSQLFGH